MVPQMTADVFELGSKIHCIGDENVYKAGERARCARRAPRISLIIVRRFPTCGKNFPFSRTLHLSLSRAIPLHAIRLLCQCWIHWSIWFNRLTITIAIHFIHLEYIAYRVLCECTERLASLWASGQYIPSNAQIRTLEHNHRAHTRIYFHTACMCDWEKS